jgi:hypothetical protein
MGEAWRGRHATVRAAAGVCALVGALATLYSAAPALAVEHHPTRGYARFADCPLGNPATELCLVMLLEGGELVVGGTTIPISQTMTLTAGVHEVSEEHLELIEAEDGKTLSKTPEPVPGGLFNAMARKQLPQFQQRRSGRFSNKGLTGLTATAELAAPVSSIILNANHLIEGSGTALTLPIKVKLNNAFLGEHCYVGSDAHPIDIDLTTGGTSPPPPNKSITGSVGEIDFEEEFTIIDDRKVSLVDNSFAVPGAEGCGGIFSLMLDRALDARLGLPSAAGRNTAILDGTVYEGVAASVLASE